ncbi:DUF1738 domain-containing protein [bacterium]|nr:DUF1738 domain-containing protein [bacterium]
MNEKLKIVQQEATALIVEQLKEFEQSGEIPVWLKPWDAKGGLSWPCNLDGRFYTGVNTVHLLALQQKFGFPFSTWGTYKSFLDREGQVMKKERAMRVFFYRSMTIKKRDKTGVVIEDEDGNPVSITIPVLKYYSVFNIAQTNLQPSKQPAVSPDFRKLSEAIESANIDIRYGADRAYYDRSGDFIRMPEFEQFSDEASFFGVLAHEAIHWTGSPERLCRVKGKEFGDREYAIEELTAELGSVMLLANFGIKPVFQSSAYISHWIDVLQEDHRLIFKIASQAQKAAEMIFTK